MQNSGKREINTEHWSIYNIILKVKTTSSKINNHLPHPTSAYLINSSMYTLKNMNKTKQNSLLFTK